MHSLRLAVADQHGIISLIDHIPQGSCLIGCGFVRVLAGALTRVADRGEDGNSLVVPGAANDLHQGIRALQHRLAAELRPVPDRWRKRLGLPLAPVEMPVWAALRAATAPMTVPELRRATGGTANAIELRLKMWRAAGLVVRIEDARNPTWSLPADAPALPPRINRAGTITPRQPTATERLWRAMRTLNRHGPFDTPILMIAAGTSDRATGNLVNVLHRAGYLRQIERGNGASGTHSTYVLVRDTGPRAPSIKHRQADGTLVRVLVDGNTRERHDVSPSRVSLRKRKSPAAVDGGEG